MLLQQWAFILKSSVSESQDIHKSNIKKWSLSFTCIFSTGWMLCSVWNHQMILHTRGDKHMACEPEPARAWLITSPQATSFHLFHSLGLLLLLYRSSLFPALSLVLSYFLLTVSCLPSVLSHTHADTHTHSSLNAFSYFASCFCLLSIFSLSWTK